MYKKTDWTKIVSLIISMLALFVSIFSMCTNREAYELNKKTFEINTGETIHAKIKMERKPNSYNPNYNDGMGLYKVNCVLTIANTSNTPLQIFDITIRRVDYENIFMKKYNVSGPIIDEEMSYPIRIEPHEIESIKFTLNVYVPSEINSLVKENAENLNNYNLDEIIFYLEKEHNLTILGDKIGLKYDTNGEKTKVFEYDRFKYYELSVRSFNNCFDYTFLIDWPFDILYENEDYLVKNRERIKAILLVLLILYLIVLYLFDKKKEKKKNTFKHFSLKIKEKKRMRNGRRGGAKHKI